MRLLLLLALLLTGCGGSVQPVHTLVIGWQSDGNPATPACPAVGQTCKSAIEVANQTQGTSVTLLTTSSGYSTGNWQDNFAVRVDGQGADGSSLTSAWAQVPGIQ